MMRPELVELAKKLGGHRRFSSLVRPDMTLLTDRDDGTVSRVVIPKAFSVPSDGRLWYPDLDQPVTVRCLSEAALELWKIVPGTLGSVPLLVETILACLDVEVARIDHELRAGTANEVVPDPLASAPDPQPASSWIDAKQLPPEGVPVLASIHIGSERWSCVAMLEQLREFVGEERRPSGSFQRTWVEAVSGDRLQEGAVKFWMPIPEPPVAGRQPPAVSGGIQPASIFLVEEWDYEASEVVEVIVDEEKALEAHRHAEKMTQPPRTSGSRVTRWALEDGAYQKDAYWPKKSGRIE